MFNYLLICTCIYAIPPTIPAMKLKLTLSINGFLTIAAPLTPNVWYIFLLMFNRSNMAMNVWYLPNPPFQPFLLIFWPTHRNFGSWAYIYGRYYWLATICQYIFVIFIKISTIILNYFTYLYCKWIYLRANALLNF